MREEDITISLGEFLSLDSNGKDFIAVRIGDSVWEKEGICAGDILIIQKQETVECGEFAMVYENGVLRLRKAYYDNAQGIVLMRSVVPDVSDIVAKEELSEEAFILGQVVEIRKLLIPFGKEYKYKAVNKTGGII